MTDLSKLKTSLTKHGAHKIQTLLRTLPTDQVLDSTSGVIDGINIDRVQASKNLSADTTGNLPNIWNQAKALGEEETAGLVFLGIVFSHNELIEAMKAGSLGAFVGTIERGKIIGGKAFTNFAGDLENLGFSTSHDYHHISYDLRSLYKSSSLAHLFRELLTFKLISAGWTRKNKIIEESITLNLHEVFGIDPENFKRWLEGSGSEDIADKDFSAVDQFDFSVGHNPKQEGDIPVIGKKEARTANLLHNKIQTSLFTSRVNQYGSHAVSTEQPPGYSRASIDVVVEDSGDYIFYEIKTARSVRLCIREALSQLQEYAYWPGGVERAKRLIVVSINPTTKAAENYLRFLREKFNLPVYYQQFDLEHGELVI